MKDVTGNGPNGRKQTPDVEGSRRRLAAQGGEISLEAVDSQGISLQDMLAGPREVEPDEKAEHAEWLMKVTKLFEKYVKEGRPSTGHKSNLPVLERAWILWNEHFVDYFLELAELQQVDAVSSSFVFAVPPVNVCAPQGKGQHNPEWSDYLAHHIGILRGWSADQIHEDLAQQRTPKDMSKLRAVVRIRRNEGKQYLGQELRRISM
jgi:hypothetical protein